MKRTLGIWAPLVCAVFVFEAYGANIAWHLNGDIDPRLEDFTDPIETGVKAFLPDEAYATLMYFDSKRVLCSETKEQHPEDCAEASAGKDMAGDSETVANAERKRYHETASQHDSRRSGSGDIRSAISWKPTIFGCDPFVAMPTVFIKLVLFDGSDGSNRMVGYEKVGYGTF